MLVQIIVSQILVIMSVSGFCEEKIVFSINILFKSKTYELSIH